MADEQPQDEENLLPEIMAEGVKAHRAFVDNMIAMDYAWRAGRLEEYLKKKTDEMIGPPAEANNGTGADNFGS